MIDKFPTLQEFANRVAMVIGKIEVIQQELYDRLLYPTAGANVFTFFANPIGSGQSVESAAAAGVAKGRTDTNMTQNGQLPAPQAFWIDNIQVDFDPGSISTANLYATQIPAFSGANAATLQAGAHDKNAVLNAGVLTLTLGEKPYYTNGPLAYFPPRAQKRIDTSYASGNATLSAGKELLWVDGEMRTLDPGLGIATGVNFGVTIAFPVLQATPSGFNGRLRCALGGWLFRAAQ